MGEFGHEGGGRPASTARHRAGLPQSRAPRAALRRYAGIAVITAGCLAFYLYHAFADQARYLTTGYDLGIFDQAVRAYAHFQAPMVPLKGAGYNIFGDHFHPIIALLAPLYWIWDNVGMLLIAQAALTAASIPVVYRFTRRRAGEPMSAARRRGVRLRLAAAGSDRLRLPRDRVRDAAAALAIDALDRRDDRRLLLWCGLLLLVREDMGLIVALFGVLVLAAAPRQDPAGRGDGRGRHRHVPAHDGGRHPALRAGHAFAYGNQFGSLGPIVSARDRATSSPIRGTPSQCSSRPA